MSFDFLFLSSVPIPTKDETIIFWKRERERERDKAETSLKCDVM
jgi:hypothetical protein